MKTLVIAFIMFLTGCSSFIIRDDDNVAVVTGKVSARTVGCIVTLPFLCATELGINQAKNEEQEARRWSSLTTEQRERELDRRAFVGAMVLPSVIGSTTAILTRPIQIPQSQPLPPLPQFQSPRSTNCTTTVVGNTLSTNCF